MAQAERASTAKAEAKVQVEAKTRINVKDDVTVEVKAKGPQYAALALTLAF